LGALTGFAGHEITRNPRNRVYFSYTLCFLLSRFDLQAITWKQDAAAAAASVAAAALLLLLHRSQTEASHLNPPYARPGCRQKLDNKAFILFDKPSTPSACTHTLFAVVNFFLLLLLLLRRAANLTVRAGRNDNLNAVFSGA
jgi:hypothetical protein